MLETLLLAIGLSLDAFSVAAGFGCAQKGPYWGASLRMAALFGLSHIFAILGGWLAGALVSGPLGAFDHWLAFALLVLVGLKMLQAGLGPQEKAAVHFDVRAIATLAMLSIATALDAVAVGASLALVGQPPWPLALATGLVVFVLTLSGAGLGRRAGTLLGHRAGILGGLVLLLIGIRILLESGL